MKRNRILGAMLAGVCMLSLFAGCSLNGSSTAAYPSKDITVIVPKGAGGGTDTSARGMTQFLKQNLEGSNFVVQNKPDGGGVTGMVETSNAKADGYTLGMVTVELAMFPHQDKSPVNYENFEAIAATIAAPAALVVPANAPYNTVEEFIDYAIANPDTVQVGNSGMGAIWHIAAVTLEEEYGVSFKHIPYPNGSADIAAALAGGHIDATVADPSNFKAQIDAGNLKILGIMADERSNLYPDVPTFKELGKDLTIRAWACLVAPKDTPADVLETLRNAAKATVESEEYKEYFISQGIDPVVIIGEDCQTMMQEDDAMFAEMLKKVELN